MAMLKKVYHSKWFPRLFYKKPDGGKKSGVTGFFLIEWKCLFSIGLLRFSEGSREAYHSHAFNAITFWLSGEVEEQRMTDPVLGGLQYRRYSALSVKITKRDNVHKVFAFTKTWALTFRGPWQDTWHEIRNKEEITLTHGRKRVA